jgi:multicomponent Na+:H+ antiporter subunit F
MAEYLGAAAAVVLALLAVGLVRVMGIADAIDRLMAVQLVGTCGVAVLLLASFAMDDSAIIDVALTLAVLAGLAGTTFVLWSDREDEAVDR